MEGNVTDIFRKNSQSPIMISYQNGQLLKVSGKRKVEIETDENARKKIKVSCDGHSYEGFESPCENTRQFLLVRKNKTEEVKIVEVGKASLVHSSLLAKAETPQVQKDLSKQGLALQKEFGGKRGQRTTERAEKMRNSEWTNEQSLINTINDMPENKPADTFSEQLDASLMSMLPPCHRGASDARQVYILEELIGKEVFDEVQELAVEGIKQEQLTEFAAGLLADAKIEKNPKSATTILFVDALIKFIKLKVPELRRTSFSSFPAISKKIQEVFCQTSGGRMTRSLELRDKAIAYCMALGLLAVDLSIPLDKLSRDIGVSMRKLSPLCRAVGAVAVAKGSSKYVLKLPLPPLPTLSKQKRNSLN